MHPAPIVIVSGAATQHNDYFSRVICQAFSEDDKLRAEETS
jgi:hypothetical protein